MKVQKKFMVGLILSALIVCPLINTSCTKDNNDPKKTEKKQKTPENPSNTTTPETVALTVPAEGTWVAYQLHNVDLANKEEQDAKKTLLITSIKALITGEKGEQLATQIGKLHTSITDMLKGLRVNVNNESKCMATIMSTDFPGKWSKIEHGISVKLDPKDKESLPENIKSKENALQIINLMTAEELQLKSKTGSDLVLSIPSQKIIDAYMQTQAFKDIKLDENQVNVLKALATLSKDKDMKSFNITFKKEETPAEE